MTRIRIIAEAGSSAAPDFDFEKWCAAIAATGADAAKFQVFSASHFPAAEQESKRPLEFPRDRLGEFVNCAHAFGLVAGVSVFDEQAVRLAYQHCDFVKLAAREQGNDSLIHEVFVAGTRQPMPVYRSISELGAWPGAWPDNWTHLFALQRYPAPLLASLAGLLRARAFFGRHRVTRWGYSSHSRYALDCVVAARLSAVVIEKHLSLSASDLEAGHSLLPGAFTQMVAGVRRVEARR